MSSGLLRQLLEYDRKSTEHLKRLISSFESQPRYLESLVDLSASERPQVACGATWMLRAYVKANGPLSVKLTQRLIDQLRQITAWDAQLHICQSVGKLTVPANGSEALCEWLESLVAHERPFVRAWSLDALCRLASQNNVYLPKARQALLRAMEDPAASVRARARNLEKLIDD